MKQTGKRGHFNRHGDTYVINIGDSKIKERASTIIHELFHMVQGSNPKVRAMEHAWHYDRSVQFDDNGNEIVPAPLSFKPYLNATAEDISNYAPGKENFVPFSEMPNMYVGKIYNWDDKSLSLNPRHLSSEVMSTGSEIFLTPNYQNRAETTTALVKNTKQSGKKYRVLENGKNAYYNPADGKWYEDAAFTNLHESYSNPDLKLVVTLGPDTGRDTNYISFVLGMMAGFGA